MAAAASGGERKRWEDALPRGQRTRALCIGLNDYTKMGPLANAIADANSIAQCIRDLPESSAYPVQNLANKRLLKEAIEQFLVQIPTERPPRIVLIFYAGHAIQDGDKIFLVPVNADPKTPEDLKRMCLSHDELFRMLKFHVYDKIEVENVLYIVILDACRKALGGANVQTKFSPEIHEPLPEMRPNNWVLCTSTSRGAVAADGEGGHSPFTEALMSTKCGMFAQDVPLNWALKMVCQNLRERGEQEPCFMPPGNIPDSLCLRVSDQRRADDENFDVFLCYRDEGEDRALAERLRDKLTSTQQGREKRPLRVFLEAGPSPPQRNVQMADAMHNSAVILLLISHSTFDGVDTRSDARGSPLHQMLWQYDMALELLECGTYHSKHRRLVPLLIGKKGAQSGCPKFEDIDENADHGEFWPINKMPDVQVESIMEDALLGLRRDHQVAKGLEAKMMSYARDTPSILRGRSIRQTIRAFSARDIFKVWTLQGREDHALGDICRQLKDVVDEVDRQSNKRTFEGGRPQAGAASKVSKVDRHGESESAGGSKAAEKRPADAGEDTHTDRETGAAGSSPDAKRPKLDSSASGGDAWGGGAAGGSEDHAAPRAPLPAVVGNSPFKYDIFVSHNWGSEPEFKDHKRAERLNRRLQDKGFKTWFDSERMSGQILDKMTRGIEESAVFLACITRSYVDKVAQEENPNDNVKLEFNHARRMRKAPCMLAIVMEEDMTDTAVWNGSVGATLGDYLYVKLIGDPSDAFEQSVQEIADEVQKRLANVLPNELQGAACAISSGLASPTPTDVMSHASTEPATPPPESPVLAMHVDNDVREFRDDMKKLIEGFLTPQSGAPGEQSAPRQFGLCELLLVAFMRDKVAPSCDSESAENLDTWQESCSDPTENLFERFHEMLSLLKPPVLAEINLQLQENQKKDYISIYVIDWIVQHSSWKLPVTKHPDWQKRVVQQWFEAGDAATAEDFVKRAENFLEVGVKGKTWGAKILGKVIETNSYVIFFRMGALAALLFHEFFNQHNAGETMQQELSEPAKCEPFLPPIRLVVSSSSWHWSSAERGNMSATHIADISARLQRIATLPEQLLDANSCLLSKIEFVEWEPLYSLASGRKKRANGDGGYDDDDGDDSDSDDDMGDGGGTGAAAAGASSRGDRSSSKTDGKLKRLFSKKMHEIQNYLNALKKQVEYYHDAASGEEMKVEKESISLEAVPSKSTASRLEADPKAVQEDMICPISHSLMRDPVRCFDGQFSHTYERSAIIMHFERAQQEGRAAKSPKSNLELLTKQVDGKFELKLEPDIDMRQRIAAFQQEVSEQEARKKHEAEGDAERQLQLRRLGYDARTESAEEKSGEVIRCAKTLLVRGDFICVIGPPACGKTITMFQTTCAAVAEAEKQLDTRACDSPPRLPVFMRATELAKILAETDSANVQSLEELVQLHISDKYQNEPATMHLLTEVLKLKRVVILIDGLDEAAKYRSTIEGWIDQATYDQNVGLMVSTREYAFESSRACRRLSEFVPVKIQELDEGAIDRLLATRFQGSLSSLRQGFIEQLESVVQYYPEMKRSPLMLCLLIEVFKRERAIPSKRHLLYQELVRGLASSHMAKQHDTGKRRSRRLQGSAADDATEFLAALAFVCHMHLKQRDFVLNSGSVQGKMREIWQDKSSTLDDMSERLLRSTVGLLSRVGDDEYRFSHLTLQEYLAARYTVGVHGNDAKQLMDKLKPLRSAVSKDGLWNKEVSRFVAGMLKTNVFVQFCQLILEGDDETGSCCEIVQDFLNEREQSSQTRPLEKMLCSKIQRIRGADFLLAGLCHPCPEMRKLVLSEMKQFRVPPNPFADGTVARLQEIAAKGTSHVWHKRAAAMLSLAQIAKMKHWKTSRSDRAETIRWMLELLQSGSDALDDVHFALVKALGTILQEGGVSAAGKGVMLQPEDESVLLQRSFGSSVAKELSDLKIFSPGLVDRLVDADDLEPSLIATGQWPIEHVHFLCENVAASNGSERASRLVGSLLHRLYSASFQTSDRALLLKGLGALQSLVAAGLYSQVLPFLESGDAQQRARVLAAAVEIKVQFRGEDAIRRLAWCLLLDVGAASTHVASGTSLLSYVLKEEAEKCKGFLLREKSTVFVFLVNIMEQSSGDSQLTIAAVSRLLLDFEGKMEAERREQKEKEKDQGKLEARATTSLPAPAAARGQTKDFAADRPDISLQALDDALKPSTPSSQFPYFTARLWSDADLIQARKIEEAEFEEDAKMLQALRALDDPWFEGYGTKGGVWEKKVVGALRTKTLGRFVFGMLLSYIKNQVARVHEGAMEALGALGKEIQAWDCEADHEKQLERNFLLKELRIGRRAQELPTWAGLVNTKPAPARQEGHSAKRKEDEASVRRQVNQEMQEIIAALSGNALAAAAETHPELRRMLLPGQPRGRSANAPPGQPTRSAKGSAARSLPETAVGEEQVLLQQLKDEVHDFDGACDWLMQITVRQHYGKDDEEGERVQRGKTRTARDYRLYSVDAGSQIRVTVRNLSLMRRILFVPVYLGEDGREEGEEPVDLKSGEAHELPYPLTKEVGDAEDGWLLRDQQGKTLLKVRFAVQPS